VGQVMQRPLTRGLHGGRAGVTIARLVDFHTVGRVIVNITSLLLGPLMEHSEDGGPYSVRPGDGHHTVGVTTSTQRLSKGSAPARI
jgi:hypothetical protein